MASTPVILAPVDGSPQSMHTVSYLSRFLSPTHVKIELMHVLADVPEPILDLGESDGSAASYGQEIDAWKDGRSGAISAFMDKAKKACRTPGNHDGGHVYHGTRHTQDFLHGDCQPGRLDCIEVIRGVTNRDVCFGYRLIHHPE